MACYAQRRRGIVKHQKLAVVIVMWIMTGSTLHHAITVQANLLTQESRITQLDISLCELRAVLEGNRVIIRQICSQICAIMRHRHNTSRHIYIVGTIPDHSQRDGPVMTTQTHL